MAFVQLNQAGAANGNLQCAAYTALATFLRTLRQARDQARGVKDIMNVLANGGVYTPVEAMFGLSSGQGVTLYNLAVGADSAIDVSAVSQLIDGVG
jgi:hypothetical protein